MRIAISILVFLTLGTLQVKACDCKEVKSIKEEFDYSKSVIVGEVITKEQVVVTDSEIIKYEPRANHRNGRLIMKYTLVIRETIKGDYKTDTITVYSGIEGRDCGFRFNVGEKYLVYGIDGTYNDRIFTDKISSTWTINCLRTKKEDKAEIQKLREIAKE